MTPAEGVEQEESITQPAKLLRIASMVRELLEQTRQASLDEPGRKRLADIYQRAVGELSRCSPPISAKSWGSSRRRSRACPPRPSSASRRRSSSAGSRGLFHGNQAAMFAQQAAAQAQFQELQRRGLMAQNPTPGGTDEQTQDGRRPGQYL